MELPQPAKPLGTEGRKPTHDFLSLYPSSNAQQDPAPSQGNYIKTHDFLQPLERVMRKNTTKEAIEKPPCSSVDHVLPGGIGTYTISYSQKFPTKSHQGTLFASNNTTTKNNDENSNISISYPANTFTIWDASASARKGKTRKENIASERPIPRVAGLNGTLSQSSSTKTFSSFSDSHPSSSSSHKNQSFMDMITSAKNDQEDEDDYDDEDEFVVKKEPTQSPSKGNVSVKVEAKTTDQKPNTPRSKHSATEQRRRSKINDRFQKLREIIPNSDQKRDKASFLLEVIEYVQFLQGKVNRYEGSYKKHESSKMMQRRNCYSDEGIIMDRARGLNTVPVVPASLHYSTQSEEKTSVISPMIMGQNLLAQSADTNSSCEKGKQQQELTIESGRINISSAYSQGLLNTLTRALQSSGVDLSQATISVQIDIGNGKRYNTKDSDASTSAGEDLGPALKRRHKSS